MVEELIQSLNQKVDKLQDDMVYVKDKLSEHEKLLQLNPKFRSKKSKRKFLSFGINKVKWYKYLTNTLRGSRFGGQKSS